MEASYLPLGFSDFRGQKAEFDALNVNDLIIHNQSIYIILAKGSRLIEIRELNRRYSTIFSKAEFDNSDYVLFKKPDELGDYDFELEKNNLRTFAALSLNL